MSMCRVMSWGVGKARLLWPGCSLDKTLLSFAIFHFVLQGQTCLFFWVSLNFLLLLFKPLWLMLLLFSHVWVFAIPWTAACQASCPSLSPGACSNLCPFNWWCHPSISSSVDPFCSYHQSFPASGSFPVSQLFVSSGQNIGTSASVSVLSMNTQGWIPLGLTSLISL